MSRHNGDLQITVPDKSVKLEWTSEEAQNFQNRKGHTSPGIGALIDFLADIVAVRFVKLFNRSASRRDLD